MPRSPPAANILDAHCKGFLRPFDSGSHDAECGRAGRVAMSAKVDLEQSITLICPNLTCGKMVVAPASARNKSVRCTYCQTPFRVPPAPVQIDSHEPPPTKKK